MARPKKLVISVKLKNGELLVGTPTVAPKDIYWVGDEKATHILNEEKLVISIPPENILWIARGNKGVKEIEHYKRIQLKKEALSVLAEIKGTKSIAPSAPGMPPKESEGLGGIIQPSGKEPETDEERDLIKSVAGNKQMTLGSIANHQRSFESNRIRRVAEEDDN